MTLNLKILPFDTHASSVCLIEPSAIWLSFAKGDCEKVSQDRFLKTHVWHNTTLITHTSGALNDFYSRSLSRTKIGESQIMDFEEKQQPLFFHPKHIIGSTGLLALALQDYLTTDIEFMIAIFENKIILTHFEQSKIKDLNNITLPKNTLPHETLSLIIPKLLQFGIRLGESHCQFFHIQEKQPWAEELEYAMGISKDRQHLINQLAPWLIDTWWMRQNATTPSQKNIPMPIIQSTWLFATTIISAIIWAMQPSSMTKAISQQYLNPDILGQLTPLATAARVGPQEILELLRNTPKSSRIKYLKWQNNQVTLKGQSQHSADAHALQKALYKKLNLPFSKLPLKFTEIQDKNISSNWTIGEES